jgi:hypothetical protein
MVEVYESLYELLDREISVSSHAVSYTVHKAYSLNYFLCRACTISMDISYRVMV